ncbi:MAG TPA: tRNA glutamyl-Q(34) synthetase GluQRS [Burkholderiaceae bacterium]|nr:tRNA glutamyl-Q(34) synthetase GluQRS [Burkholderiaceae bacterium]
MSYLGRFAPSPTGPLHIGSLATALACACDALAHGGHWILRIEDLDPPREVEGATVAIIHALDTCGFRWHGDIVYQSRRGAAYTEALERLVAQQLVYPCGCTRREVEEHSVRRTFDGEPVYIGRCARGLPEDRSARSMRMRMPDTIVRFHDRWVGTQHENPARETGDIVLKRADGYWAYHLAVVVDDLEAGINHIVRGDDLLHATARQIVIHQALGGAVPSYLHVPIVRNAMGEKLSKQTHAPAVNSGDALAELERAARHLGLALAPGRTLHDFWLRAPDAWASLLAAHGTALNP